MTDLSNSPIGKSIVRKEDFRFLTGAGQYTDDVVMPRQTHAVFLRSPHAHAGAVSPRSFAHASTTTPRVSSASSPRGTTR